MPTVDNRDSGDSFTVEALPLRADLQRVAYRYTRNAADAEELVQETYLSAWTSYGTYQPGTNIRAWLVRILVNNWVNSYRKSTRRVRETLSGCLAHEPAIHAMTATPSAEDVVLRDHTDEAVKRSVARLPTGFQAVIFYADICDYTLKEVAAIQSIPLGTAMSRRHRGLQRLRTQLGTPDTQPGVR